MKQQYEFQEEEFDDYLDGGMHPDHRAAFEGRLATDPALREAFEFHQKLRDSLFRRPHRAQIKDEIAPIHRKMLRPARLRRRFLNWKWSGILLLLVAAGALIFWMPAIKKIFFPAPTPTVPVAKTNSNPADEILLGTENRHQFERDVKVDVIEIKTGQTVRMPEEDRKCTVTIINSGMIAPAYEKNKNNRLHLSIPGKMYSKSISLRLTDLRNGADTVLFLKLENDWYVLPSARGALRPVTDRTTLQRLQ